MKAKALFLLTAVAAMAFASQDAVRFVRTYQVGEKDTYNMSISANTQMGQFDIKMQVTNTIKKVYENGDADQETAVGEMKLLMNGNEMPMPGAGQQKPTIVRVNKFGQPADPKQAPRGQAGMMGGLDQLINIGGRLMDREFKVGERQTIDQKSDDGKSHVTGTVLLESITDGMAKVVSDLNIKTADAPQPLKVQSTIWVHVASGKATKVEGTAKNIPSQGFQIDDLKFTMQLVK